MMWKHGGLDSPVLNFKPELNLGSSGLAELYFIVNIKYLVMFLKKKNVMVHFKIPPLDKLMQQTQDVSLFFTLHHHDFEKFLTN